MKKIIYLAIIMVVYGATMQDLSAKTLYIEEVIKSTMTGPQMTAVKKSWFGENRILIADSAQPYKVLFDLKGRRVVLIDDINKRYSETSMDEFRRLSEQGVAAVFKTLTDSDILIKESGTKKKIGKYSCSEVNVLVPKMSMKTTMWITGDIPVSLEPYYSFSERTGLGGQMQGIVKFLRKKKAYTVESISSTVSAIGPHGIIHVELRDISFKDVDIKHFEVPRGYTKVSMQ